MYVTLSERSESKGLSGEMSRLRLDMTRPGHYSTVTLFARFRGLSTSQPRMTAEW
jgi:hypothetical protein